MGLFDDVLNEGGSSAEGGLFDDVLKAPKKQNKGIVADLATDLKRGVQNIPSAITGLADIPVAAVTGSPLISAAAEGLGKMTGFQPGQWAKDAEQEYSEGRKQARQNIDAAWKDGTAGDIASAYLQNPSQIAGSIVESLPSMLVGGLAGRAALGIGGRAVSAGAGGVGPVLPGAIARTVGEKLAPAVGAGLGEGAVMAGQAMDNLTEQGVDPRTAAGYAAGTGIVGAALGAGGGKVAQMLGVVDPETAIAGGAARAIREGASASKWQVAKETGKNIIGGGISEGIFEELPQSVMEQGLSNLAQGKPIGEGVARAGVEGALAGFGMGAGFNAIPARQEPQGPLSRTVEAGKQSGAIVDPDAIAAAEQYRQRGDVIPAGSFGQMNEFANFLNNEKTDLAGRREAVRDTIPFQKADIPSPLSLVDEAKRQEGGIPFEGSKPQAPDWSIQGNGSFANQAELANLIESEKADLNQRRNPKPQNESPSQGDGSFSTMNEFADLLNSERQQVESSRRAIAAKQALRRESDLESADARVADSMAKESEQKRRSVLESVLADPAVQNHAAKFSAELKRQGFRNFTPTESELSSITRFGDILNAKPETTTEPSLPNEATAEQLGIKERKEPSQAQGSQRDKIAEVQQLVSAGWKVNGRTLVSPTGKKRNLNFAERYAAVKAQQEKRGNATQAKSLAQEATQANDEEVRTQPAAAQEAEGVAPSSVKSDSGLNRTASWVIRNKKTGEVVLETFDKKKVDALNTEKYEAVPIQEYLGSINGNQKQEQAARQKESSNQPSVEDNTPVKVVNESRSPAPIAKRDDLVGAIMRVTGGKGIASSMKLDVTGDTKGNNRTLSGLFTDNGTADLGEIAELLSLEEGYSVRDGSHLAELVRDAAAGNMTYSMARTEREAAENAEKEYKASVNQKAEELGLKKVGGKRTLAMVEADIAAKEKEISEQEAREERASIQASEIAEDIYQEGSELTEADLMQWLGDRIEYSQDEINEANSRASERESRRVEKNAGDDSQEQAQGSSPEGAGTGATEAGTRSTESLTEPTDDLISRAKALGMKTVGVSAEKLTKQVEEAESFNLSKQTNEQAAAEYKRQQEEANKKDEEPTAPDVKADQVDMWNTQGSLIDNNREPAQSQQKTDAAPESAQDNAPAITAGKEQSQAESIEDFGEKLEGARKDRTPSLSKELSDEDIATQPLSNIWPAAEIDAIENIFAAAVAYSARNEIPAKPRKSYLVARWVEKVKMLRGLASKIINIGEDKAREIFNQTISSSDFKAKVALLESIDRDQWKRIGTVSEYPNAYRYGENGEQIKSPIVRVEVDGKVHNFDDATSVADVIEKVNGLLGVEQQAKKMQFEVRGRGDRYFINKKGDKEYRKLKEFTNTKDAFAFIKDNYDDLAAAWDGVKDRDNVTKADVRNAENRPRTGSDWRNGKDVTAEQFQDAFGFRGGQFGKWVTQGSSAKERQWMLNQAYDALMDLSSIVGIPPKAISLNGSLGLAFGARGSGNAAAHFEPDTLVINLTKTKGAGSLAHEWFHALDNYFSRQRGGEVKIKAGMNAQQAYRTQNFITYRPEPMYVHKSGRTAPMTKARLEQNRRENPKSSFFAAENWQIDPNHPAGVRPEVERSFAELVEALDGSPMKSRSAMNDKATDGYWSRIIERGARSFENFVIFKMMENGYNNDYLANVRDVQDFPRAKERYPYLLPEEVAPIAEAFDNLFATIKTKETDNGIAMYSFAGQNAATADTYALATAQQRLAAGEDAETVRKETGWFKGAEGKWKYEISDADARLKADGETFEDVFNAIKQDRALTVSDVIDHPALFAAYPAIGNLRIRFIPFSEQGRGNIAVYIQNGNPMFGGNRIEVERTTDSATALSAILHEIQHGIQTIEGFASGGSNKSAQRMSDERSALKSKFDAAVQQFMTSQDEIAKSNAAQEMAYYGKRLAPSANLAGLSPEEIYTRLAGEVEARNTQSRQNMTDAERRATPPSSTADVADSEVIVVFNGKEMASAPAPANAQPMQQPMQQSAAEQRIKSLFGDKVSRLLIESGIVSFVNRGNAYQGATFENGNIVLNLDALSADNFDGVLLHEGLHSTLRQLVGDETYGKLMKQLESMLKMGNGAQWVADANAAVPDDTKPENVTEEIAAYAVEQVINGGKLPNVLQRWVDNFLSAIRTAIIQHLPSGKLKNWAVMNLKAQDLARLAKAGLKAKAAGMESAQREAMAYSKDGDRISGMTNDTTASRQKNEPAPEADIGEAITPQLARDILLGRAEIPDGWYVHGRARSDRLNNDWPIQMTQDIETAINYSGNSGSVWMIRPKESAVVADFSSADSDDMEKFIANLRSVYETQMNDGYGAVYELVSELNTGREIDIDTFEEYVRDEFTPVDIVDSAQAFDNDMWINLLQYFNGTRNGWPDFVIVPSGAVVMPGEYKESTEYVNLTALSNEPTASAGSDAIRYSKASQAIKSAVGAVTGAENKIVGASNRQYDQAQRQFFKNVGRDVERKNIIGRTLDYLRSDFWKKMAVGVVDQFRGLRDLNDNGQAYLLARLSKGTAGAFDALLNHGKLSIRDGVYDADTSGGFLQRLGITLNGEIDDFLWWTAANRAENLSKQDRENLFTAQDIAAGKSLASGTTDFDYTVQTGPLKGKVTRNRAVIYADANRVFNEFQKNALDMAEQSGLIDGSTRHLWESEFYVPFYRVSDEDGEFVGAKMGNALVRQSAFKKLKGGTDKLNADLLANTLMNWSHLIEASAKNRAAKASLEAAGKMGAAQRVASTMGEYAQSNGSMLPPGTKGTVWYMDGGNKVEYLVSDPFVMTAITSLEYAGMRNAVMDVMSKFKHYLTIGVTANPAFKIRNLIRDSIQAIGTSDLGYNPITNIKEGIRTTKRDSQEYVSALASGGLIRFGTMLENSEADRVRQLIKSGVKDSTILNNESKLRAFYDQYLEPAVAAYNELGNRSEEINRAALYNQLIKQGRSHAEAALLARDLMDFSLQGSFTTIRFLSQVVPFFNARLQGMYKLGRSTKDNPAKLATVIGACAVASIALMLGYDDDEDWKRREDFDRDGYFWFKFGGLEWRIPKPFEVGAVASLAERTLEYMINDEMTGERYRKVVSDLVKNNLSMNPVPQVIKPIIDLYANKDSFTGRPIETMNMQRLEPEMRFNSQTSMVARGLSNATAGALSPVQYDHIARAYFGWLGSFAVGMGDMAARAVSDEPEKPTADYFKLGSFGFAKEAGTGSSRYVSMIYDQAKELEQAYATYRQLVKDGKMGEAQEYMEDNKDKLSRYRSTEAVKKAESRLNEQIRLVEKSNLSADEKRERINAINKQKEQVAMRLAPGLN